MTHDVRPSTAIHHARLVQEFECRLCRRNPDLGEASEGAVEAPADVNEGVRAFLDKRPPKYQGR